MARSAFPSIYFQDVQGAKNSQIPAADLSAMYLTLLLNVKTRLFAGIHQSSTIRGKRMDWEGTCVYVYGCIYKEFYIFIYKE